MKKYILFGLTLLMAFPVSLAAQEEDATENDDKSVRYFAFFHGCKMICNITKKAVNLPAYF